MILLIVYLLFVNCLYESQQVVCNVYSCQDVLQSIILADDVNKLYECLQRYYHC